MDLMTMGLYPSAALSGGIAGLVAILVTLLIEKFGGVIGGVLGTIPTTIIPASIAFWINVVQNNPLLGSTIDPGFGFSFADPNASESFNSLAVDGASRQQHQTIPYMGPIQIESLIEFQRAMLIVPAGMVLNTIFLYCWKVLPRFLSSRFPSISCSVAKFLGLITILSLSIWFGLALLLVLLLRAVSPASSKIDYIPSNVVVTIIYEVHHAPVAVLAVIATFIQLVFGVVNSWHILPAPKGTNKVGVLQLASRGVLAAAAVFLSVLISTTSPFAAGVASIFPAIFLTSMVSLWLAQGSTVPVGAVGPLMLGSLSVSIYAILVALLVPHIYISTYPHGAQWSAGLGFFLSWFLSVIIVSLPCYLFMRWRARVREKKSFLDKTFFSHADDIFGIHAASTMSEEDGYGNVINRGNVNRSSTSSSLAQSILIAKSGSNLKLVDSEEEIVDCKVKQEEEDGKMKSSSPDRN